MERRRGIRVPVAAVAGRTVLNLLRPRRPLRRGITPRYIEGDPGRGVLGVTEMSIMVLEGVCSASPSTLYSALLAHRLVQEDITLYLLRLGRYSMSRSGGRSFGKWVLELTVSWCSSIPLLSCPRPAGSDFEYLYLCVYLGQPPMRFPGRSSLSSSLRG